MRGWDVAVCVVPARFRGDNGVFAGGRWMMSGGVCVVVTTVATRAEAEAIGEALLVARLAACVQYEDIRSHYVWQGALHCDAEVRVSVKSCASLFPLVEACILRLHPYDCPQVLRYEAHASAAYRAWMDEVLQDNVFM